MQIRGVHLIWQHILLNRFYPEPDVFPMQENIETMSGRTSYLHWTVWVYNMHYTHHQHALPTPSHWTKVLVLFLTYTSNLKAAFFFCHIQYGATYKAAAAQYQVSRNNHVMKSE